LETRDTLLTAIGKARVWIDDLVKGRASSFAEIARGKAKSNVISASLRRWRSYHPGSLRPSSTALRRLISP
jgi:hypothetical protein